MEKRGMAEVSIVLPAYNEEKNIPEVIKKSLTAFQENGYKGEVIVIDDGSSDRTGKLADEIARNTASVKVFHHHKNKGLTEALQTGFKKATGDIIVFLCSDQQSDPLEDIPKLVNKIREGYDVVLGWRKERMEMRLLVSKIYHWLSQACFGTTFHDMNWIKAFRREVVLSLKLRSDWHRYIPILAYHEGYRIAEIPTTYYSRGSGKTKFGTFRIVRGFLDLVSVKFHVTFLRKPLLLFGMAGMCLLLLGLCLGAALILLWLFYGLQIRPAMLLVLLLILSGVQLFAIGLLAESLVGVSDKLDSIEERLTSE